MNRHQRPVYFDQGGAITQKFKVTSVPARLQQEGSVIRVKEGFNREEAHAH
jgi:conjugal transfer pilus assembly protein TraW